MDPSNARVRRGLSSGILAVELCPDRLLEEHWRSFWNVSKPGRRVYRPFFIVSGIILYYFPQIPSKDWLIRISMGMLLGGAIGNLIDRLTLGYVTDFISVGDFPVFNIADSSISVGVVVLFFGMWRQERRTKLDSQKLVTDTQKSALETRDTSGLAEETQVD